MDSIFDRLSEKQFQLSVIFGSFLGDVIFIIFLRTILFTAESMPNYIEKSDVSGRYALMSVEQKTQLTDLMLLSVDMMLVGFMFLHLIVYMLYMKGNRWSFGYIKNGIGLFGIIFSLFTFLEAWPLSKAWALALLALTPIYIFIFFGMRNERFSLK